MTCKYGNDNTVKMPRSLKKYLNENPLCKLEPVHAGYCEEHIPYLIKRKRDYENTPIEVRQKYLDALNEGKSIGEAYEIAGITFEVALEITNAAIGTYHFLEKEAR